MEDLLSVYGAIDRAVGHRPGLRDTVADHLPPYADAETVGWFEQLETWMRDRGRSTELPDLPAALDGLAHTPPASGRLAARRIVALAVLARLTAAAPAEFADVGDGQIHRALGVEGISAPSGDGDRLLRLLTDDDHFGHIRQWAHMIEEADDRGAIDDSLRRHAAAPPCAGHTVSVPTPDGKVEALEISASFETDAVTFDQATRFLDPAGWPRCGDWWKSMTWIARLANGRDVYREVFSLAPKAPGDAWSIEAFLEFARYWVGNGAFVEYELSPDHHQPDVVVDRGHLWVRSLAGPRVAVDTVKVVAFRGLPLAPGPLAMSLCALGYGDEVQHLVLDCAADNADDPDAGSDFPAPDAAQNPLIAGGGAGDDLTDAVTGLAEAAKGIIETCAQVSADALQRMTRDDYGADEAARTSADLWLHWTRAGAAGAKAAMDAVNKASGATTTGPTSPGDRSGTDGHADG